MFLPVDPLAGALRKVRRGRKISQGDLAKKIGTSREQLCRWEKGTSSPTLHWLRRWMTALELTSSLIALPPEPEATTR